jgi:hypothetical protein
VRANIADEEQLRTTCDEDSKECVLYPDNPAPLSKDERQKRHAIRDARRANFLKLNLIEKSKKAAERMLLEDGATCKVQFSEIESAEIPGIIFFDFIGTKLEYYHRVKLMYEMQPKTPVLAECHEMTMQAGFEIMLTLLPGEKFFIMVSGATPGSWSHTYGVIVSKAVLMGEGLKDKNQKQRFVEKFSRPFFETGKISFEMGTSKREVVAYNRLFWKALGLVDGSIVNQEAASQVHLCDAYGSLYCNGLGTCLTTVEPALMQTHLKGLFIRHIYLFAQEIPEKVRPHVSDSLVRLNEKVNQRIQRLVDGRINAAKEGQREEL